MMRVKTSLALLFICVFPVVTAAHSVHEEQTVEAQGLTIHYVFHDAGALAKQAEITELIEQGFNHYTALFGGLPRDLTDTQYRELTVKVRSGDTPAGEADPKIIWLTVSDNKAFGFNGWQTMLLHELFHLWSAETFRYATGKEHWFNEGFAEYYAFRTAAQLGLLEPDEVTQIAAQPIGYYLSGKGLGRLSIREAGADNQTKFEHYFLIYHGGWVAAMVLDHDIRRRSNNTRSLDDLFRWLYVEFVRSEKLYSQNDLIEGLKKTTGYDYTSFFSQYIDGTETIAVSEYFNLGQLVWDSKYRKDRMAKHDILRRTLGLR